MPSRCLIGDYAEQIVGPERVYDVTISTKSQIRVSPNAVPDFDIEGIFGKLAHNDYDRAVQLARGFQGEAPRANATIAICQSVLNEKSATPVQRKLAVE